MLKQDSVFVCEACGCKYSLEEVKKLVAKVDGMDDADALYNRALDWLKLQNESKAVETLEIMVEKYPGDKRGWQKLALTVDAPNNKTYMETAMKFFDDADFIKTIEEDRIERNRVAMAICDEIRKGGGVEWIEKIVDITTRTYGEIQDVPVQAKPQFDFPCVNDLLSEGKENAATFNLYWNSMKLFWWETKELIRIMWKISDPGSRAKKFKECLHPSYGSPSKAFFIYSGVIGLVDVEQDSNSYGYKSGNYDYYYHWFTCETLLSESVIRQTFSELREKRT